METVVIDNGSTDSSATRLQEDFPGITILASAENLGVAAGRNLGARKALAAGAQYVFFLDNDTEIHAECLTYLVKILDRDPSIGAVAPAIYVHNQANQLFSLGGIYYPCIGYGKLQYVGQPAPKNLSGQIKVDWLGGVAILARREIFETVGFFDEDHTPYGAEDLDWGLRIRKAGYRLCVVPEAVVWHKNEPGYAANAAVVHHWARAHMLLLRKHVPLRDLPLSTVFTFGYLIILRRLVPLMWHRNWQGVRDLFRGIVDGLTINTGKRL